jgi:hypothetical protein
MDEVVSVVEKDIKIEVGESLKTVRSLNMPFLIVGRGFS